MILRIASLLAVAFMTIGGTAAAQDVGKTLHWRRLDVEAHLDAEGRMRVRERQAIVFNGEWNGGERTFNIRPGQRIELNGIHRIDANGVTHALERGELDRVDRFDWTNSRTLRWRSRLATDPPFANQEIVYELDYTLSNILTPNGELYELAHDFAFPERSGVIENFTLVLNAADVWEPSAPLPLRQERTNIEPGASVVATLAFRHTGASAPSGVARGVTRSLRLVLAAVLAAILFTMLRRFYSEEKTRGRFEPLTPVEEVNPAWLRENIFNMPAEVVGAAWDNRTSSPEVAAMIARMVLEGKLASRVESIKGKDVLHLELKVPRADLPPDELKLIAALFSKGDATTDTERIKKRYKKSGFDPAALIAKRIQKQINVVSPNRRASGGWRGILLIVLAVMTVGAMMAAALVLSARTVVMVAPAVVLFFGLVALVHAGVYRSNVADTRKWARRLVWILLLGAMPVLALLLGVFESGSAVTLRPVINPAQLSLQFVVALVVMYLSLAYLVLRVARTNETPGRLELRRTLAAGRLFFVRELKQKQPKLDDAWFPYLLAFGLGKHIDKWFRAFGVPRSDSAFTSAAGIAAASGSPSGWSGGGPLFGGGGGFGGGGTGRTWAASVETLSAGVSAPSSGGSGGSSGGSSSSGGGGGGGW